MKYLDIPCSKINSQVVWRGSQDAWLKASADHCKDE